MDFQVLYTEPALNDLEILMTWSWERHPDGTEPLATSLLGHVDLLKKFPFMGTGVRGLPGVRRLLHTPFHVYYRVHPKRHALEILHIWHASRNAPAL